MKAIPVILAAAFLLIGFSSGTALADDNGPEVHAMTYPSVTLNVTSSAFYNLTFLGMVLKTQNQLYVSNFHEDHWDFTKFDNTTYFYTSNIRMVQGGGPNQAAPSEDTGMTHNSLDANVNISLKPLAYNFTNAGIQNGSFFYGNYSLPEYSVLELSITMSFSKPIQGPGTLYLYQLIKSSNESKSAVKYYLGNFTHNMADRMNGYHQGLLIPSNQSQMSAFYWWNNTFMLNGHSENLSSLVGINDGGIYIAFDFPFNNSLSTVFQDPYIGVPGTPLFKNPIIHQTIGRIVNYFVIHAEYLGTGVAGGILLLGVSYSIYRRRRF